MLFNSYVFLFVFLPAVLLAFWLIQRVCPGFSVLLLGLASLGFYGWWNSHYLILMCASIVFNFGVAHAMGEAAVAAQSGRRRRLLILGVTFNLTALGYFKYAGFLLGVAGSLSGADLLLDEIILPLGISFFTFTQIAFLVDTWRDGPERPDFSKYFLFVTFFPHLIAGPIYHHKEMLPQYARLSRYRLNAQDLAAGSTIFVLGLFKKTVFADGIAPYSDHMFSAAAAGAAPGAVEAWTGTIAYALQIYFDFSGYSDMAIGLARLFGIALPLNFASPYKAQSIIEFWRRWHMTLSRFLRDYLYIVLGGNRRGRLRTQVNIGVTMLLGGLWHGANWTFVAWGAMHGVMLILNHAWRTMQRASGLPSRLATRHASGIESRASAVLCTLLTFVCVLLAWVLFRAGSLTEAESVYRGMLGLSTTAPAGNLWQQLVGAGAHWCALLLAVVWLTPNTQQILGRFSTALNTYSEDRATMPEEVWWRPFTWHPGTSWAVVMAVVSVSTLVAMSGSSRFLYFQF